MILMRGVTIGGMWLHMGAFEGLGLLESLISYNAGAFLGGCGVLKLPVTVEAAPQGFAQGSASPRNRTFVFYASLCTF